MGDSTKRKNYDEHGMSGDQQDQYKNYYNQSGGNGSNFCFRKKQNIFILLIMMNNSKLKDPFGGGFGGFGQDEANFKDFWEGIDEFFGAGQKEKSKKGKDIIVKSLYQNLYPKFVLIL